MSIPGINLNNNNNYHQQGIQQYQTAFADFNQYSPEFDSMYDQANLHKKASACTAIATYFIQNALVHRNNVNDKEVLEATMYIGHDIYTSYIGKHPDQQHTACDELIKDGIEARYDLMKFDDYADINVLEGANGFYTQLQQLERNHQGTEFGVVLTGRGESHSLVFLNTRQGKRILFFDSHGSEQANGKGNKQAFVTTFKDLRAAAEFLATKRIPVVDGMEYDLDYNTLNVTAVGVKPQATKPQQTNDNTPITTTISKVNAPMQISTPAPNTHRIAISFALPHHMTDALVGIRGDGPGMENWEMPCIAEKIAENLYQCDLPNGKYAFKVWINHNGKEYWENLPNGGNRNQIQDVIAPEFTF